MAVSQGCFDRRLWRSVSRTVRARGEGIIFSDYQSLEGKVAWRTQGLAGPFLEAQALCVCVDMDQFQHPAATNWQCIVMIGVTDTGHKELIESRRLSRIRVELEGVDATSQRPGIAV